MVRTLEGGGSRAMVAQRTLFSVLLFVASVVVGQVAEQDLCKSPLARSGRIFIDNIPENTPQGATIGNTRLQGSQEQIVLLDLTRNEHVNFDPDSQNLTVTSTLDREAYDAIEIQVECYMKMSGFRVNTIITIRIKDVNDNPPEFQEGPYATSISELMPIGATILTGIQATDPDSDNWKITFEVEPDSPYADHFTFPIETNGALVLQKLVDYEAVRTIELHIVAKDHPISVDEPQRNTTASVWITITDGDDQNPAFSSPSYLSYVTENAEVGTVIELQPALSAVDQDIGILSPVYYSFLPDTLHIPSQTEYFDMDNNTGVITLGSNVLRRGEQFFLLVRATQTDNPDRYATTSLNILVQAANENQPRFLQKQYATSLVENVPTGSYVTTVTAIDNDVGSVLTYSFTEPMLVSHFHIDPVTGEIVTDQSLSYEQKSHYNISVSVTDGKWLDQTFLVVDLLNVNNHNPEFSQSLYTFRGHKEDNFYIGRVKATDLDVGSSISYQFVQNSSFFTLYQNGDIRLTGDLSEIADDGLIQLFVTAEDDGAPPRRGAAAVHIRFGSGNQAASEAPLQTDLVIIIILAVLCGCLLLIIVVLGIYVYRNSQSPPSPSRPHPYTSDVDHIDAYFETSKSFERGINDLSSDYKTGYLDSSEGVYKPATRDRHLALYHDMGREGGTTVQENPFIMDHDSPASSGSGLQNSRPRERRNSFTGYSAQSLTGSTPGGEHRRDMNVVNEIDYTPSIAAMDGVSDSGTPRGSYSSAGQDYEYMQGPSYIDTFKVGNSTQALVPPHSPADSSVNLRGKGSSVSFIDDHQVNVYHPDNAIHPGSSRMPRDKPEITVYY